MTVPADRRAARSRAGTPLPDALKILLVILLALALTGALDVGYSAVSTLRRLTEVEAQRDGWQRPDAIVGAAALERGDTVIDLGCGSGYFTLKLSGTVGPTGTVIAEDIRRLPLLFLRIRTWLRHEYNVRILLGEPADPGLPAGTANAVLIVNTYHEIADRSGMLAHVRQALVPGGRVVIADRQPTPANVGVTETDGHEMDVSQTETELRAAGFRIVSRDDRFIASDPDAERWWELVAVKP